MAATHAFPLDTSEALAYLLALRERLRAARQRQRDDDYVRRTPANQNPRARRGSNWELYWILNTPLGGPTVPQSGPQQFENADNAAISGNELPWWMGG